MKFQTYGSYEFPPLTPPSRLLDSNFSTPLRSTFDGNSGESGVIIQGGSPGETINLKKLLISWGSVETAGRLEISAEDIVTVVFLSAPSGFVSIDIEDLIVIDEYGLQCTNNSVGGEYVITAYYSIV